jgi:hypothetical protein
MKGVAEWKDADGSNCSLYLSPTILPHTIGADLSDFLLHIFSFSLLFGGVWCVRARKRS